MTDCPHGFTKPTQCLECMTEGNLPPAPRPPAPTVVALFTARYPGECRACNLPIVEGQRIASLSDGAYVHDHCAPGGGVDLFGGQ